jgi:hypothetical protein
MRGQVMSKTVQAIILGFVVALVVGFGMWFLLGLDGEDHTVRASLTGAFAGIGAAYLFGNLSGNRKIANASDADKRAALGRQPPPGKALVFLYREGFVAKLAGLNIVIDDKPVAQLKSPRFTAVVVPAGDHAILAKFGGLAGSQSQEGEFSVHAPADGAIAVKMTIRIGVLKGGVAFALDPDLAEARSRMQRMPMTPPDLAEI